MDISLTSLSESAPVPYLNPELRWLRNLLGGFLFGVGMTLAGGCSSKNMLRFGGGDLKSLLSLLALGLAAWSSVYTETGGQVLVWLGIASIDLSSLGSDT